MSLTTDVFAPDDLAGADPRDISFLLASKAYNNFYEPLMLGLLQKLHLQLADPTMRRHMDRPDDYLRGGIMVLRAILNFPQHVLEQQNQRNAEERDPNEGLAHRYAEIARDGYGLGRSHTEISPTDPI